MLHLPLNYNKDHDIYRVKLCDCQHLPALGSIDTQLFACGTIC